MKQKINMENEKGFVMVLAVTLLFLLALLGLLSYGKLGTALNSSHGTDRHHMAVSSHNR